jgi:deoxyribodipyrimidine photolyase-like uncharacterized protein
VFSQDLMLAQFDDQEELAGMMKSPRKLAHRMTRAGYIQVASPDGGRWSFNFDNKQLTTRYVFVKNGAAAPGQVTVMVREHAKQLLARAM